MTPDIVSYGYALIVFAGGVIGYLKAGIFCIKFSDLCCALFGAFPISGSMMSLGSGIAFGAALGYGAYRLSVDPKDVLISLG